MLIAGRNSWVHFPVEQTGRPDHLSFCFMLKTHMFCIKYIFDMYCGLCVWYNFIETLIWRSFHFRKKFQLKTSLTMRSMNTKCVKTSYIAEIWLVLTSITPFYNANLDLHAADITWEGFKAAFRERFMDVRPEQFYFSKLQMAKQGKNEDPQEFADRCRGLAQKVMGRDSDPIAQRIHRENAERMCLASFVGGAPRNSRTAYADSKPANYAASLNNNACSHRSGTTRKGQRNIFHKDTRRKFGTSTRLANARGKIDPHVTSRQIPKSV